MSDVRRKRRMKVSSKIVKIPPRELEASLSSLQPKFFVLALKSEVVR